MNIRTIFQAACFFVFLTAIPAAKADTFLVTFGNAQFLRASDGPFFLDLTLIGDAGNSVDVTNFKFSGPGNGIFGTVVPTGDATGSVTSGIMLSDSSSSNYNDLYQQVKTFETLTFDITMTNLNASFPDTLTVSLLDSSLLPVPTLDPTEANTLLTITLGSTPQILTYATDASQSNSDITYPILPIVTASEVAAAPESPTLSYSLLGFAACFAWLTLARRRRAASGAVVLSMMAVALAPAQTCQPIYQAPGSPVTIATGREATGIAIADFDGDGIPDMAVLTKSTSSLPSLVAVLKGNLTGEFTPFGGSPFTLSSTLMNAGNAVRVAAADFNHDGKQDLVIASDTGAVVVLTGSGNGQFNVPASANLTLAVKTGAQVTLAQADLNGDGYPDVVLSAGFIYILLNSQGTLAVSQDITDSGAFVGDVNGDGFPDLIGAASGRIFLNNTHGSFTQSTTLTLPPSSAPVNGVIGDFNGDGKADFLFVAPNSVPGSMEYQLFIGDGTGNFAPNALVATGITLSAVLTNTNLVAGDFNGDGRPDFAFSQGTNGGTAFLYVFEGIASGGFAEAVGSPFSLGSNAFSALIAAGDINADGRTDLVATSLNSSGNGEAFVFLASSRIATIGMTTSANPGITGASLTLTAVVGGAGCSGPTGNVTFTIDNGAPNSAVLSNGQATVTLPAGLTAGVHNIQAAYSGDANFGAASVEYVEFIGGSTCSPNLTAQVTVKTGGFVYDRAHQQFVETVSVTNNGPGSITGPVSLALDGLSSNATLAAPSGYTSCATPAHVPLADMGICPATPLVAGGTASVILRFANPSMASISYTPRVLAGLAVR